MPREIKFRAWDRKNDRMRDWDDVSTNWAMFILNEHDRQDWMQFTGLFDKNGKEIYEGDIVSMPYVTPFGDLDEATEDGRFKVGFENGQLVIYRTEPQALVKWCQSSKGEYISNYGNKTIIENTTVLEVIGNIYENPELLDNK